MGSSSSSNQKGAKVVAIPSIPITSFCPPLDQCYRNIARSEKTGGSRAGLPRFSKICQGQCLDKCLQWCAAFYLNLPKQLWIEIGGEEQRGIFYGPVPVQSLFVYIYRNDGMHTTKKAEGQPSFFLYLKPDPLSHEWKYYTSSAAKPTSPDLTRPLSIDDVIGRTCQLLSDKSFNKEHVINIKAVVQPIVIPDNTDMDQWQPETHAFGQTDQKTTLGAYLQDRFEDGYASGEVEIYSRNKTLWEVKFPVLFVPGHGL